MSTPFEDLEYLADFLPDEGETMLISRRDGELVCEPFRHDVGREGITDSQFYGRLVQANEQLSLLSTLPLWGCALGWFWLCFALHKLINIGWSGWFLDLGLGLMMLAGCFCSIRYRQRKLFRAKVLPMIEREIRLHGLEKYAIIGSIRQHSELRCVMDELSHWTETGTRRPQFDA